MFTRIDHVTICVPDLLRAMEQYGRWASTFIRAASTPAGARTMPSRSNRDDYIELLAIRDPEERRAAGADSALEDYIAAGRRHTPYRPAER